MLHCVNKYDVAQTFLRLCEMEGDCDEDGYSRQHNPDNTASTPLPVPAGDPILFAGTTTPATPGAYDQAVAHHMPTDDGSAFGPLDPGGVASDFGRRLKDDGEAESLAEDAKLAARESDAVGAD